MPDNLRRRLGAERLPVGESEPTVLLVGGEAAKGLASQLGSERDVLLVSGDEEVVRAADRDGIEAREADVTSGSALAAHTDGVTAAVVAAERDRTSLLAAQLLHTVCDVEDVAVLLNDPANHDLFENLSVEFLADRTVLGREIERTLFGDHT